MATTPEEDVLDDSSLLVLASTQPQLEELGLWDLNKGVTNAGLMAVVEQSVLLKTVQLDGHDLAGRAKSREFRTVARTLKARGGCLELMN